MATVTTKTKQATVGILMPCYNLGEHMHEALDSLFGQTFQDFELVIADDGSTDKATLETLRSLSLPHGKVFFEKSNRGLNVTRNKYMSRFDTEFVFSFDPD